VSVRRIRDSEALSREFTKVSTESVWRQLLVRAPDESSRRPEYVEVTLVVGLAVLAGLPTKIPAIFGRSLIPLERDALIYLENASLFVLPSVAVYLIWKRSLSLQFSLTAAAVFILAALLVNLHPTRYPHDTTVPTAAHLPIALILFLGVRYSGPSWKRASARLDFVRFAGEVFIYSVLLGLGGLVLIGVSVTTFEFIDITCFVANWIALFGGGALPVVAAHLVERKKGRLENIGPMLARIFSPLFLVVFLSLLAAMVVPHRAPAQDIELLIWFDLLLALVLALTLYTTSARDAEEPRRLWDVLTPALLVVAFVVNGIALFGIISRLLECGLTPTGWRPLGKTSYSSSLCRFSQSPILGSSESAFATSRSWKRRCDICLPIPVIGKPLHEAAPSLKVRPMVSESR